MTEETCGRTGKVRYTRKAAQAQANRWKYKLFARMNHYHCKSCESWHIGNNRNKPRTRR